MHFALVTETYPPEVNGVALTVQHLHEGLCALGHHVELIRPRRPNEPESAQEGLVLGPSLPLPRYPSLRFGLPIGRRLLARWRQCPPDAVYIATEGPLGYSALRAARRLGIPVATGYHTRFPEFMRHYRLGALAPLAERWLRRFHNRAQATLVPTRALCEELRQRRYLAPCLLTRGVDTALFHPGRRDEGLRRALGLSERDLLVIYVGRIAPEKNLGLAVRAFRAIAERRPDARYLWVGDGPARTELARENPDFLFIGTRRGEELARHFASADLFLFPSLTDTFGNVVLEAMASGVATVAYDDGAAREHLAEGCGVRVPAGDEHGFIAAALGLAMADDARAQAGYAARRQAETLDQARVAGDFARLLAELALRKSSSR
ncbi:MAG: glycosyl transferase [Lysobacterales bacterium]|jgi:glycosyltransferase involved in cell wall biosynthesis|nr:MAG: glycosyl transferase [Xanthomonadales bacterium]